jgi:HSP20 family molecular chaperone IbpA
MQSGANKVRELLETTASGPSDIRFGAPARRDAGQDISPVDIDEYDSHYEVTIELPGVEKSQAEVRLRPAAHHLGYKNENQQRREQPLGRAAIWAFQTGFHAA